MKKKSMYYSLSMVLIAMLLSFNTNAQKVADTVKSIKIGDKVPNFIFKNMINYPTKELQLKDLKDKLVIINSWAYW